MKNTDIRLSLIIIFSRNQWRRTFSQSNLLLLYICFFKMSMFFYKFPLFSSMVMTFIVIMNNLALIVRDAEFVLIFTVCVCLNFMRFCAFLRNFISNKKHSYVQTFYSDK